MSASVRSHIKKTICATCLSQNRKMFRFCDLKIQMKYLTPADFALCASDDMVCWECKAHLLKMSNFRARAATAQAVLRTLVRGQDIRMLKSLSNIKIARFPPRAIIPPVQTIKKTVVPVPHQNTKQKTNQDVLFVEVPPLNKEPKIKEEIDIDESLIDESEIKKEIENQDDISMDQNIFASELDILEGFNLNTDLDVIGKPVAGGMNKKGPSTSGLEIGNQQIGGQQIFGKQVGKEISNQQLIINQKSLSANEINIEINDQEIKKNVILKRQLNTEEINDQEIKKNVILKRQLNTEEINDQEIKKNIILKRPLSNEKINEKSNRLLKEPTGGQKTVGQQVRKERPLGNEKINVKNKRLLGKPTGGKQTGSHRKGGRQIGNQQPVCQKTVGHQKGSQEIGGQQTVGQKTVGQQVGKEISDQQVSGSGEKRYIYESSDSDSDVDPVEVVPSDRLSVGDTYKLKFGSEVKDIFTVNTINHQELTELRAKRINSKTFARCKLKCENCVLNLLYKSAFEEHMWMHKRKEKYVCDICTLTFRSEETLKQHRDYHYRLYKCCSCKFSTLTIESAMRHFTTLHQARTKKCKQCKAKFATVREFMIHRKMVHGNQPRCEMCGERFYDTEALEKHITESHGEVSFVECQYCHHKFRGEWALQSHIKRRHKTEIPKNDEIPYCAECDKHFATIISYKAHVKTVLVHNNSGKDFKYQCDHCKKKFATKWHLRQHIADRHLKIQNFQCNMCEQKFTTKKRLRIHRLKQHEGYVSPKDKVCEFCSKAFPSLSTMRDHLNMHKGLRPYVCNICGNSFSFKAALFTHRRLKHKIPRLKDLAKEKKNATENIDTTTDQNESPTIIENSNLNMEL